MFSPQVLVCRFLSIFIVACSIVVADLKDSASECPPKSKTVLESRANVENCAKKLFSSPGAKRGFTRHPSLIKLVKSIQDDRRKINSAPSSPAKDLGQLSSISSENNDDNEILITSFLFSGAASNTDFPNKMAQLAAICKIELDQEEA